MIHADVRRACARALSMLPKRQAVQLSPGNMKLPAQEVSLKIVDDHLIFVVGEILKLLNDEHDSAGLSEQKAHRWLGFLQGALWMRGYASLDELRDMNRPR